MPFLSPINTTVKAVEPDVLGSLTEDWLNLYWQWPASTPS